MKSLTTLVFFLFVGSTHAAGLAKVVFVRGKATKLLPHEKAATVVTKGEMLPEDTSIVTEDKSIVKIVFPDKSSVNIGPNSKLLVAKIPKKKANMLNLLNGAIKSAVEKESEKSGNKMIIKTRSAVMGVRGTKFQTIYNPVNKNTSLVTIEGKVAMAKVAKTPVVKEVTQKTTSSAAEKTANNEIVKKQIVKKTVTRVATPEQELEQLDKVLDTSKDVVEVNPGRFAGVVENADRPTSPVKIAPKQYDALAKSMDSKKTAEEVMKVDLEESSSELVNESTAEATSDVAKATGKEIALRPGGYVDFETGLYVAPPADSKLDKVTGTFEAKEDIGSVDATTGDYVPPKGVELDAKKGFVIKKSEGEKVALADDKKLQQTLAKLNQEVKKQVVVNKMETEQSSQKKWYSPENHLLSVAIIPFSEIMEVQNKDTGKSTNLFSSQASKVLASWKQKWNDTWSSQFTIGNVSLEWDKSDIDSFYTNNNDGGHVSFGASYQMQKLRLSLDFVNETVFYVYPASNGSSSSLYASTYDFHHFAFAARYFAYDWKAFKVHLNAALKIYGSNSIGLENGDVSTNSSGFNFGADADYVWSKSLSLNLSGQIDFTDIETDRVNYSKLQLATAANLIWTI